jgi:hypothetical protein
MAVPKGISSHPGVVRVMPGEDQGSDLKHWVFLREGWGFYESGQRNDHCWISGGFGVDSVAEFREIGVEYRPEKELDSQPSNIDDDSSASFDM